MTDKIMEARRAKFEEWDSVTFGYGPEDHGIDEFGEYSDNNVQQCWMAYNAALDSLCVGLPEPVSGGAAFPYKCYEGGWNDALVEAQEAIHAAGVKTK